MSEEMKNRAAAAMQARNEWRREKWGTKDEAGTFVPGEWAKAYGALLAQMLEGKTCNVAGCVCGGTKPAAGYLKQKGYANTRSPSPMHSFGEVAAQIVNADKKKTLACEKALEPKRASGSYVKKADRLSQAVAEKYGLDPAEVKRVMEDA